MDRHNIPECYVAIKKDIELHVRAAVTMMPAKINSRRQTIACHQFIEVEGDVDENMHPTIKRHAERYQQPADER